MSSKEDEDILHHVLNMIFELDDTSPFVKTLKSEGWDIFSFITEPHLAIETLNNVENVPHWQLEYISMFSEYFYYQQNHGGLYGITGTHLLSMTLSNGYQSTSHPLRNLWYNLFPTLLQ